MNSIEKLVLDTHVIIWYLEGIKLSKKQVELIDELKAKNGLYISAISIWEIAMLSSIGKINFSVSFDNWINKLLSISGLNLIQLSSEILIASSQLIHYEHKDPADRIIIASCRETNSYLMTFNQKIVDYGNQGYLKIIKE